MIAPTKPARILDDPAGSNKPNAEKKKAEARRIDAIVELDKRRKEAKGARDREALLEIAAQYTLMKMPNTASMVVYESEHL